MLLAQCIQLNSLLKSLALLPTTIYNLVSIGKRIPNSRQPNYKWHFLGQPTIYLDWWKDSNIFSYQRLLRKVSNRLLILRCWRNKPCAPFCSLKLPLYKKERTRRKEIESIKVRQKKKSIVLDDGYAQVLTLRVWLGAERRALWP